MPKTSKTRVLAGLLAAGALASLGGCASTGGVIDDRNPSWEMEYHWMGSQGRRAHAHTQARHDHRRDHHVAPVAPAATHDAPRGEMLPLVPASGHDCGCCQHGSHGSAVTPH